ncbi:MAG TPA: hypothetical protein VMI31_14900, partial [Fimbriimonadaceae bacterium]|nr:hypothetical protein [Fimbriimonadaceae bacterium]
MFNLASYAAILLAVGFQGPVQDQSQGQRQGRTGAQTGQRPQRGPATTTPATGSESEAPAPMIEVPPSTTKHTIALSSGPIAYTAEAAQIPLRNDDGQVECRMFSVTYTKDDADTHARPVTFAFNGGPGSASFWLHMGAIGPKRAPMNDDGTLPAPPYQPVDNADTWLDFTDVCVIDAPGTGFSRIARPDLASKYYGVTQDLAAFTQFIKNWLTIHRRWNSPIFIAGESYGGIRGSGLANSLFRAGVAINGFVSISGTSNFMTLDGMRGNDLPYISYLPSMAAVAWYHHKLGPQFKDPGSVVKEVQDWIDKEYAAALERGDSLSDAEKDHIASKLSEYLGISKAYCLGSNLRVSSFAFFTELLRSQRLQIGRYDGRLTGKNELEAPPPFRGGPGGGGGPGDPSDDATTAPFTASINQYLEDDLKVKTDLPYLNEGNTRPWQEPEGSYAETATDLRNALARNQHLRV